MECTKMNKSKLTVVGLGSLSEPHTLEIDWQKCCLCQKDNISEPLTCPASNPILKNRNLGYISLGANLEQLKTFNYILKSGLKVNDLDEGDGIQETLTNRAAKYHKNSCARQFLPVDKIISDLKSKSEKDKSSCENVTDRATRSSSQPLKINDERCFLCMGIATRNQPLHQCATKEIYENVKSCAEVIGDSRLIAMLGTCGDLVALEAKYHMKCISRLYAQKRRITRTTDATEDQSDSKFCESMAFAELVLFMQSKLNESNAYVFQMGKLNKMYSERINQLLNQNPIWVSYTSRLREKILSHFSDLEAIKSGREYILRTKSASMQANLNYEDDDENAIGFYRFTQNMRKCVLGHKVTFTGNFAPSCERDSIPGALLAAMSFLLYGSSEPSNCDATAPLLTVCQLIVTNMKTTMPQGEVVRHSPNRETPLVLYTGLAIYGRSRDKTIIQELHQKGISVSPNRITQVTSQLCRMVVKRAEEEQVVCPSDLRKGCFTVAAIDNFDVRATSLSGRGEFHGTSISIFQHPTAGEEGEKRTFRTSYMDVKAGGERSVPELPDYYSTVPDCVLPSQKPSPPEYSLEAASRVVLEDRDLKFWEKEESWLSNITSSIVGTFNGLDTNFSYAAYHASQDLTEQKLPAINSILPLLYAKSADPSTIKHGVDKISDITRLLNGDQPVVIGVDQPLFAIGKILQWNFPQKYGSDKLQFMFGPLHIEMDFLRVLGDFLENSGWTSIVANSGIKTAASAEALLKVTHVKRAREAHQVTAAVLHTLLQESYELDDPDKKFSLDDWATEKTKHNPTFYYWLQVLNIEILLLTFVKSVRQSDYLLYKDCLHRMLPWFFLFDRQNYARWLTVHSMDLEELETRAPELHRQFLLGKFTVNATGRKNSAVGIDHRHEQNNKELKSSGGAVGLTHDPAALRRFTVGAPEVSKLLHEFNFETISESEDDDQLEVHHEQTQSYQTRFLDMCTALRDSFYEYENPFTITSPSLLVIDHSRMVMEDNTGQELLSADAKGAAMVKEFVEERLVNKTKAIYDPIKKCSFVIFGKKKKRTQSAPLLNALKSEVNLYSRLFIVCTARNLNLQTFFEFENQSCPPSISLNGVIRSGVKSHLVDIMETLVKPLNNPPPNSSDALALDGPVLVHSLSPPATIKTFKEYAICLASHIRNSATKLSARRIDVVWDMYSLSSLKSCTRESRGAGVRRQDLPTKGNLPQNWKDYLRNDENKTELFAFLSDEILSLLQDMHIVTNVGLAVQSTVTVGPLLQDISLEGLEEADGRIILHAMDMVCSGVQRIVIRSSDTDVLVLAISFCLEFQARGLKELWVLFGTGKARRYVAAHDIASVLGERKAPALRFFHCLSGCDTVSYFSSRGKRTAFTAWTTEEETEAFFKLSHPVCLPLPEDVLNTVEKYIVRLYGVKDPEINTVNGARQYMFATLNRPVQAIPLSRGALIKHILRAAYQAGQVWGRAADGSKPPSPESWGWALQDGKWQPVWTDEPTIWAECRALDKCGCSTKCETQRCKCRRLNLPCTPACKTCKGSCTNQTETLQEETEENLGPNY